MKPARIVIRGGPRGEGRDEFLGHIRRTIVDDDDFEIAVRLRQDTMECPPQAVRLVAGRNGDANKRGGHAATYWPRAIRLMARAPRTPKCDNW